MLYLGHFAVEPRDFCFKPRPDLKLGPRRLESAETRGHAETTVLLRGVCKQASTEILPKGSVGQIHSVFEATGPLTATGRVKPRAAFQ